MARLELPPSGLSSRLRDRPPVRIEQCGAEVERVARGFPDQRKRGRPTRRETAGQRILLEGEPRFEFPRQILHADVFWQADDLDRLDAVVGGGAQDALEQHLADAPAAIAVVDRERRLGMDMAAERGLLAPDRLIGAQFGRADHFAVRERPVNKVALAEAVLGIAGKNLIRHPAAEALVPAARVEAQEMIAKRFFVRWPKPPDFQRG